MMTGKELTRLLREAGTGEDKLNVCRNVLTDNPRATANAVLKALRADCELGEKLTDFRRVPRATLEKAEQIARDGKFIPPPPKVSVPIEDLPDEPGEADEKPAPKPVPKK